MRFCYSLDESLAFLIIMLTANITLTFIKCSGSSSRVRNRFTYMAINTPFPNKITFQKQKSFSFSIHASDLLRNVTSLNSSEPGLHQFFSLLPGPLSKSVNLFPNCMSSVGARAYGSILNHSTPTVYILRRFNFFLFFLILMGKHLALSVMKDTVLQI